MKVIIKAPLYTEIQDTDNSVEFFEKILKNFSLSAEYTLQKNDNKWCFTVYEQDFFLVEFCSFEFFKVLNLFEYRIEYSSENKQNLGICLDIYPK